MSKIGNNLVYLLVSQMATWVMTLVILVTVPDLLGDEVFGRLSYTIAYAAFVGLLVSLGSAAYLTKEIARDHSRVGPYVFNAVVMKVGLSIVLSALAILVAVLLGNRGQTLVLMGLACVSMTFASINDVLTAGLGGMERMGKPAAWVVVQIYAAGIVGIVVLLLDLGVVAYAIVLAVAAAVPVVGNARLLWPYVRQHTRIDPHIWRLILIGGLPLFVLGGLNLIYGTVDIPILEHLSGESAVGWYTLAYRWVGIPIFIATAVVTAFFPQFSAHGASRSAQFVALVNRAVKIVLIVSIPAALGIAVLADDILDFFYSSDFENSIPLMRILALHIPLAAMDTILAMALIASDRQRRYVFVAGIAAVLNPIACVIAINLTEEAYGNGAIGAAIVTVGTELFIMLGALFLRSRGVMDGPTTSFCLRCVSAGLAMAGVIWVADPLWLPVKVALGLICYVLVSMVLGTFRISRAREVLRQVGGTLQSRRQPAAERATEDTVIVGDTVDAADTIERP